MFLVVVAIALHSHIDYVFLFEFITELETGCGRPTGRGKFLRQRSMQPQTGTIFDQDPVEGLEQATLLRLGQALGKQRGKHVLAKGEMSRLKLQGNRLFTDDLSGDLFNATSPAFEAVLALVVHQEEAEEKVKGAYFLGVGIVEAGLLGPLSKADGIELCLGLFMS